MKTNQIKLYGFFFLLFSITDLNSQTWGQVGTGCESVVTCFAEFNGKLYVGGFGHIGFTSPGVAAWDGLQWAPLGDSINPGYGINAVAVYNNELIVGGSFPDINFIPNTGNIAAFDGNQWHSLGTGIFSPVGTVYDLEVYNGELYAGGAFLNIGGINSKFVARWNGTNWKKLQSGLNGIVYSFCVYNNELYVGGFFNLAGGNSVNNVARWTGTQWDSVGVGVNGYVFDMVVDNLHNNLIIGGNFANIDTSFGLCICAWNGTQILPIGHGLPNVAKSLCVFNNILIAAQPGAYTYDTMLLYWDSLNWQPILGLKTSNNVLRSYQNELYVGGYFDTINTTPFAHIAKCSNLPLSIRENNLKSDYLQVFPNPSNGKITIQYMMPPGINNGVIKIYDYGGKLFKNIKIKERSGNIIFAEGTFPKGIHIASLNYKGGKNSVKFVVQ